jgi:hypothetical protein
MGIRVLSRTAIAGFAVLVLAACQDGLPLAPAGPLARYGPGGGGGGGGGGHETTAGNKLSFPVIWAEGVTKALQGTAGAEPALAGEWWWWWETDATEEGYTACLPDLASATPACADGGVPGGDARKAWLQKDEGNVWQAGTFDASGLAGGVRLDLVDWGDDLEAKDWTTKSMIRIETVLYQNLVAPYPALTEYVMRHVSGWGADEVWGVSTFQELVEYGPGTQATVYTPCARLTMQRLTVDRDDDLLNPALGNLAWSDERHVWEDVPGNGLDLVAENAVFNLAVHEAGDGPGFYNAEVNVKGMIIFGYTLNARRATVDAGDYRLTFSLDALCGAVSLNTFFTELTQVMLPVEEDAAPAAEDGSDTGGGVARIDVGNNLTYMDIRLTGSGGSGGRGGGGGGGGGGGPRH